MTTDGASQTRWGLAFGLGAYGLWGVIPFYFKALRHLPPLEVLAHRVVWSFLLLACLLAATRSWRDFSRTLGAWPVMSRLLASAALIAVNWFTYIWAVTNNRVLEASLGYFITPLVNVLLGALFLGERLRRLQLVSLMLAGVGVAVLASQGNGFPVIAVTLAISFAFYGLMRKTAAVDAAMGLFVETLLLAPLAMAMLGVLQWRGTAEAPAAGGLSWILLVLGGPVTTTPLLFFAGAARRLSMSTLGFLQYLAPSLQFLLAVVVFHEPFSRVKLFSFAFIWAAVAIYSAESVWRWRQRREQAAAALEGEATP